MPRKFKGGKKKTRGKRVRRVKKGAIVFKDDSIDGSQLYGTVVKRLGGRPAYILILCEDGVERKCVVRGKFTKKVWLNPNDVVLINYNKDNDNLKGEIEVKYTPQEVSKLKREGLLSNVLSQKSNIDSNITFGEEKKKSETKDFYDSMKPNTDGTFIAMEEGDDEGDFFGSSNNNDDFNFDFNSI